MPPTPPETYEAGCYNCRSWFDAAASAWCDCVVKERSLICPSCGRCFCSAPAAYKQRFWGHAPQSLWDRKLEEHRRQNPEPNPPPAEVERPLVLIVDDEREVQQAARRVVAAAGYGVITARDGEEGLAVAEEYLPDVILTDVLMPKLDGREMCHRIKTNPATQHIKVVVMTSLYVGQRYKREATSRFLADEYLSKPLDARLLQEILRRCMNQPTAASR